MSSISGVSGSGSNAWAALNTQRSNHQARMFAKVDSDGSGSVDQAELTTMLDNVSEKTGASFDDAAKVFTSMDADNDGSLSATELDSGMKSLMQAQTSTLDFAQSRSASMEHGDGPGDAGGPPPGPPPRPPPGEASGSSSTASAGTTYDPLDTNEDGTVSLTERLAGSVQSDPLQALFKAIDTDSDGKINGTESEAFARKLTDLVSQVASNSNSLNEVA
jgi:Ca2+-binding EF-hand superfamily protein